MECGQTTLDRASQKLMNSSASSKPHVLDGGSEAFRKLNGLPSLSSTTKNTEPDQQNLFASGCEKPTKPTAKPKAKPKAKKESAGSKLEASFDLQCRAMLPAELQPQREQRFHPTRMWRFDFSWPEMKIAVECDGGVANIPVTCNHCRQPVQRPNKHSGKPQRIMEAMGRHSRMAGFEADCEKLNEAQALGWRVFRYTASTINDGSALRQVRQILLAETEGETNAAD